MATDTLQYLDPDGLGETVLNIAQIKTSLDEEMQNLPYARPDGIYPDMTVGAVIGAYETAQWAQRVSTGSGAATVRSVQGAAVVWNQLCDSISANGNVQFNESAVTVQNHVYLFAADVTMIEGATSAGVDIYGRQVGGSVQLLARASTTGTRASIIFTMSIGGLVGGSSHDEGHFWGYTLNTTQSATNGMLFDLTQMFGSGNEPTTVAEFEQMYPEAYYPYSAPTLKPVQIAGIASTNAQGGELDAIEWTAQELWGAGAISDMLYSDRKVTKMATLDMGTLAWQKHATKTGTFYASMVGTGGKGVYGAAEIPNCRCIPYTAASYNDVMGSTQFDNVYNYASTTNYLYLKDASKDSMTAAEFKASLSGVTLVYELAEPTTTPISPALPMTYRVQQDGSETVIVPDGEVSAAPVLTIAEPVNMSTELARIWAAIESLGYTRNAAHLSRPVSLTDTVSIDEVQKDTTEIVEIDTTKEVQE